jgi:deazaflavin-dependent oxidoreductase (nitroreductase family)
MITTVLVVVVAGVAAYIVGVGLFERLGPRAWVRTYQRNANRLLRRWIGRAHGFGVIETVGRRSGRRHQTPVGGRLRGDRFWCVAGDASHSDFVRNIEENPRVRVRIHGAWREGTAVVLHDDRARRRLLRLNPINSAFLAIAARDPRTIRIDLD